MGSAVSSAPQHSSPPSFPVRTSSLLDSSAELPVGPRTLQQPLDPSSQQQLPLTPQPDRFANAQSGESSDTVGAIGQLLAVPGRCQDGSPNKPRSLASRRSSSTSAEISFPRCSSPVPSLQPPKLNLAFSAPGSVPPAPMSAGPLSSETVLSLARAIAPQNRPSWIHALLALDNKVMLELHRAYAEIDAAEAARIRESNHVQGHPYSMLAAQQRDSMKRNRYYDIIPYDRTRVHLQTPSLPEKSDYINATHVRGLDKTRDYIISQGPLHNTSGDFWQMILEQGSALVVMLTREEERGRVKCHRYWPSIADQPVTYSNVGGLTVTLVNESTLLNGEATLRELQLTSAKDPSLNRKVWQLHFVDWPDHRASAPASVLAVLDLARQLQRNAEENGQTGPMVVHCSAGCGRTGTLCTIDSVLLMLEQGQEDDQEVFGERDLVRATVEKFREQRVSMVQTLEQYVFCYEAILYRILEWQKGRSDKPSWIKSAVMDI